jgi:Rrf2 family cysteine metabolism transcriptional repressor
MVKPLGYVYARKSPLLFVLHGLKKQCLPTGQYGLDILNVSRYNKEKEGQKMRISAKARYSLASMIYLADIGKTQETVTVLQISTELGISKIYLEQTFALLKRAGLVLSIKGPQGGYQLSRPASKITVLEIIAAVETSLFEETESTVAEKSQAIDGTMADLVFTPLAKGVERILREISLEALVQEATSRISSYMFFI